MSSKVKFNNGEGVDSADFNSLQDYQRKLMFDSVLLNMAADAEATWNDWRVGSGVRVRPLGSAGFVKRQGANTVRVNGGLWIGYTAGTAANADAPTVLVANKDTVTDLTIANAPATQFRRDIIQCRLVEADVAAVSRDFKDATTGALSSTSLVKRTNTTVEYLVKAGTAQSSSALANANEPTADAGYTKIASVLASSAGLAAVDTYYDVDYWDWREPWGTNEDYTFGHEAVGGKGAGIAYGGWATNITSGAYAIGSVGSTDEIALFAPRLHASKTGSRDVDHLINCRIKEIALDANWGATPIAGEMRLKAYVAGGSSPSLVGIGWVGTNNDVSLRVSGFFAQHTIFNYDLYPEPPLWATGRPNAYNGPDVHRRLYLQLNPSSAVSDLVYGVSWQVWGTY